MGGEFEFHPEEYNPLYLPIDSWLLCKNYDGEHGRTIIVSLAEYIIDDETLKELHEIEESVVSVPQSVVGLKSINNNELQENMPKSPKTYLDQINIFKRNSVSIKSLKKDIINDHDEENDINTPYTPVIADNDDDNNNDDVNKLEVPNGINDNDHSNPSMIIHKTPITDDPLPPNTPNSAFGDKLGTKEIISTKEEKMKHNKDKDGMEII